jgi:hypothetical protein
MRGRLHLLSALSVLAGASVGLTNPLSAQTPSRRKDIPTITKESTGAVVLVIASDKEGKDVSQGSGFLVSKDGRVITNYHVVENASTAIIKFDNGAFYSVAGLLVGDEANDVAILKADGKNFPTLALGDSGRVQVGEEVVAIGNPLSLETTVSNGIISAKRQLGPSDNSEDEVLQITAPISPGSSGGPLFNMRGEVIGITTFQITNGQNLNFAIPINLAKRLLADTNLEVGELPGARQNKIDLSLSKPRAPRVVASQTPNSEIFPTAWISAKTGQSVTVRASGDYLYEIGTFYPATNVSVSQVDSVCDTKKQGNQWLGTCSYTYTLVSGRRCPALVLSETITMFSPQRIEGDSENPLVPIGDVCPVGGIGHQSHFVLIPAP